MIVKTLAKVNLTLNVNGRRTDGYHLIESVMQAVSLYDELEILKANKITVKCNLPYIPCDSRNIAHRAADAFFKTAGIKGGAAIYIKKKIPVGAGMGGGSSNAAGVLRGLNSMYNTGLSKKQLSDIGAALGTDVPFFFGGGTGLATGAGEVLKPISSNLNAYIVIIKPQFSINTKWAYQRLDQLGLHSPLDSRQMVAALQKGDINNAAANLFNIFEGVVEEKYSYITHIKQFLINRGAKGALMTGSGSAVFGIFQEKKLAQDCASLARGQLAIESCFVCKPVKPADICD